MPAQIADLRAKVSIDGADKAKKDLADLKGKAGGGASGGGILGLADGFKTGLGAVSGFITGFVGFKIAEDALGAVKDQLLDVLQAGMDQQKVMAQTAAVIKSTGGAAHISASQVGDLADSLAQMSGVSDDTIQGAENILLTFDKINKNIFPQTTQLVLDLSTAFHQDLQSSAVMVGKALQDPIQGVTALRRVGVQLSDNEVELVKKFMATGQVAKAQGVIMGELTRQVGGSAKAYGETLPGQLARLNVSFDQAKEKIALAVIPILQKLLDQYVMPLADWLGKHLPAAITVLTTFINTQLVPAITGFMQSPFVKTVESWAQAIADKLDPQLGTSGLTGHANTAKTAIKNLDSQSNTTTSNMATTHANRVQTFIDKADALTTSLGGKTPKGGGSSTTGLDPAILKVNADLAKMDAATNQAAQGSKRAQQPVQFLGGVFDGLGNAVARAGNWFQQFGQEVGPKLGPALNSVKTILGGLQTQFSSSLTGLQQVWDGFWGILSFPVRFAAESVRIEVNIMLDGLRGDWKQMGKDAEAGWGRLGTLIAGLGQSIWGIISGVAQAWLGAVETPFKQMWATLKPVLDNFGNQLKQWWSNLLYSLQQFINDHAPHLPPVTLPSIFNNSGNVNHRASGGPISGPFIGAERGPELLVTPGLYNAPPGSYVYNAQQTSAMLSGKGGNGKGGNTYNTYVYPQQASIDTQELARIQRRRELLLGMY